MEREPRVFFGDFAAGVSLSLGLGCSAAASSSGSGSLRFGDDLGASACGKSARRV